MPLSLATGAQLVGNQTFQNRAAMAFYFVARQVLQENPTTNGHAQRVNFARSIVMQDYTLFMQYAALVATDTAIVAAGPFNNPETGPSDALIIDAVTTMWNRLAGVQTSST